MPLSLANGICTPQFSAFLMSIGRCSERHEKSLSGFARLPLYLEKMTGKRSQMLGSTAQCNPSRHVSSLRRRRRSKQFEKLERILSSSNGNVLLNNGRVVEAHSVDDPSALVLDRHSDEPVFSIDEGGSSGPRKIEVVGKDLDLEEEIGLLRRKGKFGLKKRKKHKDAIMRLFI